MNKEKILEETKDIVRSTFKQCQCPSINFGTFPIYSNDKDVEAFINQNNLNDPEKLIKFLIEAYYAPFEAISSSLNDLKELDLINTISDFKAAKKNLVEATDSKNEEEKKQSLCNVKLSLNKAISALEDKIRFYINKTRAIDQMPPYKRILKSRTLLQDVDNYNDLSKKAITTFITAIGIKIVVFSELREQNNVYENLNDFEKFNNDLKADGSYLLMHNFDKNSDEEFWLTIHNKISSLIEGHRTTTEKLEIILNENQDIDFDDVIF